MAWLFPLLPFFIVLYIVVSIVRAAVKAAKNPVPPTPVRPSPANFDPAAAERTRRIQEEIRRKIAERRGQRPSREKSNSAAEREPPALTPETTVAPPALANSSTAAVLQRQEQLADQMRALEAARWAERRKAAGLATVARETDRAVASAVTARGELLADLRGAATLRRALVLREVLGPPVAWR